MSLQLVCLITFSVFFFNLNIISVFGQCLPDQQTILLQLRDSFLFDPINSTKIIHWNQIVDCCHWRGVNCDKAGHVIGLDLDSEYLKGELNDSSSLFSLEFLQVLNLSNNFFNPTEPPSAFGKLLHLTDINLTKSGFRGQVPSQFSHLTRLVSLSLVSSVADPLILTSPNLDMLIKNLTQLRELHLDYVIISTEGYSWSRSVAAHLPDLHVLSLTNCQLSGPLDSSLLKLQKLSVIQLDENLLSCPFPHFFSRLSSLTLLSLSGCDLNGTFPPAIFQMPTLQSIDVSFNSLSGFLPEFPSNGSLQFLRLSHNHFSGNLPYSIGELQMLSLIDISNCNFSGPIPNSGFSNLQHLYLTGNSLNGSIPASLYSLPAVKTLDLSYNQFSGQVNELVNMPSSFLQILDLSYNKLEGPIPMFFFQYASLEVFSLSSNNFNGRVEFSVFANLVNLSTLSLSHNNLSVITTTGNNKFSSPPRLSYLHLAACKLQQVPDLKTQSGLIGLDLSENQITGEIPNWIWQTGKGSLLYVNLSHNYFSNLQEPYVFDFEHHFVLDLHSNLLRGKVPIPTISARYLDYSSNNFESYIPFDIGNILQYTFFFSISSNKVVGQIPPSICKATNLELLNLSNNSLQGAIPSCLFQMSIFLGVLDLGRNNLSGMIPVSVNQECSLETLDLSQNQLEGKLPKGLTYCTNLEVLNLYNNRINDTFPCWLQNITNLRVFVLGSNSFHGQITCHENSYSFPNLQIMDLSHNKLSGVLPPQLFSGLKAIMVGNDRKQVTKVDLLHFQSLYVDDIYYQDRVFVNAKGTQRSYEKLLTTFSSIDLSNNNFHGIIPVTVGDLKSVIFVNFSHNFLVGPIPSSLGNLSGIESLDLSDNKLSGHIPTELLGLTLLSSLNLSYNELVGRIPSGPQVHTWEEDRFRGNKGLCGFPLKTPCKNAQVSILPPPTSTPDEDSESQTEMFISIVLGFLVGLIILFGPLVLCKRWRKWYNTQVDSIVLRIVKMVHKDRRNTGTTHTQRKFRDFIDSEDEIGWNDTRKNIRTGKHRVSKKVVA